MPRSARTGVVSPGLARAVMVGVAVVGISADQATKQWAIAALAPADPVPLLGRFLQLYLIRNPGAAFSLGEGFTIVFTLLAAVVLAGLLLFALPRVRHWVWALAFGLVTAGVAGNLIDRVGRPPAPFHGHVVDFLMLPHWPVFNIADSMLTSAAVLVVALSFLGSRGPGGRPYQKDDESASLDEEAKA
ncbi:signal peptidase II Aspartic peptidase. MEROPS family A08 [Raineyella antarctica]|uniref:Lipoprotein signal peptidase n=1 Tax=Raineyella antarctica TaxID=1577474 RepID=A0A1G6GDU3_9ACTN|nr:signal peptidase II [Raineyella antarctica]SDB80171.1 signal peptidase II Aspartic peptidase. MEROPS family A08 [Raineyella antarctica]